MVHLVHPPIPPGADFESCQDYRRFLSAAGVDIESGVRPHHSPRTRLSRRKVARPHFFNESTS
jgi:hypothetical protein